ncbi:hypothetical protein D5F01_LYC24292 [Larimichthys crocea]|uniref:Uncharacterized protein n=1 Tax=Larimichthys crocea TaxID=215358 RepID=A0A6G0HER7_LARCR|nr:hypothetical protein D5F01_LYC24292 [Larimichthys crocea]
MRATTSSSRQQLDRCERELAEVALEDRGSSCELEISRGQESCRRGQSDPVDYYERYGLIPIHRDVDSWVYVSEDPQLAIAMEEVVNTFSPALSVELLLYNILGSNNDSATCLVRYLINYYSSNHVCEHIKTTLRNMIRWSVLAGFVPCVFLPWKKVRALGLGLSGKATVTNLISCNPVVHKDAYRTLGCSDDNGDDGVDGGDRSKRRRLERHKRPWRSGHTAIGEHTGRGGRCKQRQRQHIEEPCLRTAQDGFSPPEAASEAVQEREAHERALHSVLDVPPEQLAATLKLLMSNSVPDTLVSVLCRIVQVWVEQDVMPKRDPIKETEMKIALVTLWGVMKTFEHVDGVLYRHISVWDGCWARGSNVSSLAKRAHPTVKSWATLFHKTIQGLTTASNRHVYTSTGVNGSSLAHLADLILSSRGEQQRAGLSVAGNAFGKPLLDNLSRFLASDQQPDMFGLNMADLPDVFLRSGVGTTVSEHKSASVSHSLSKMMASMISEGKEVLLVRQFLGEVTRRPRLALEQLKSECEDRRLLQMAESIVKHLEQADGEGRDSDSAEPVTELGSDVKLVCSYPSSVSVAHLEETLSMWTNFWRSALSGFNSLSGRRPDASLTVNDIMLTRDSLHPTAYGLLLANKLGLRPSDVKCKEGEPEPEREPQVEPEWEKGAIEAEKSICVQNNV